MKTIARGAEAVLGLISRKGEKVLVKDRVRKGYRVPELDRRIRAQRTRTESRLIFKARRAGVKAPRILGVSETEIVMEFIHGPTVKGSLNGMARKDRLVVYQEIGKAAASLHRSGIMHGDLTTSNLILREGRPGELYVIDFGLARTSQRIEDFAVDMFLLYEALKAAHFRVLEEAWESIIKAYKYNNANADSVLERLSRIEKRRRYRGE